MRPSYDALRTFTYKTCIVVGALTLSVGISYAATTIGTNIVTDGSLNVGSLFGVATSSPGSLFSVGGVTNFTAATSTFYSSGGINLAHGCYAVNGTCVGSGGGGTTPSPLPFFGNQTNTAWVRPSLSTFSMWLNQSPGAVNADTITAATATDNAGGLPLVLHGNLEASERILTGVLKPIGAPPWTITTGMAMFTTNHTGNTGWSYPIILYNSGSDSALALEWGEANGESVIERYQFSDTVPESGNYSGEDPSSIGFAFQDYFEWFRVADDGTNLTFSISPDGLLFIPVYTEPVAGFITSIDKVGFGFDRYNAAGVATSRNDIYSILWSWVETSP